jgi:hypothetical protein
MLGFVADAGTMGQGVGNSVKHQAGSLWTDAHLNTGGRLCHENGRG